MSSLRYLDFMLRNKRITFFPLILKFLRRNWWQLHSMYGWHHNEILPKQLNTERLKGMEWMRKSSRKWVKCESKFEVFFLTKKCRCIKTLPFNPPYFGVWIKEAGHLVLHLHPNWARSFWKNLQIRSFYRKLISIWGGETAKIGKKTA